MRCIAYDFQNGFENCSCNHKDEEGKEKKNWNLKLNLPNKNLRDV
jgi:hypothetical protein